MIEQAVCEKFLRKFVVVVRNESKETVASKGVIIAVTDQSMLLEYRDTTQAISLSAIDNIREVRGDHF